MVSRYSPSRANIHTPKRPAGAISLLFATGCCFGVGGFFVDLLGAYRYQAAEQTAIHRATATTALVGPIIATMDSPVFEYSPGWHVTRAGADPSEPANPWVEPAGIVTFPYRGNELALQLAAGDFWGYLTVTVDGRPANLLPNVRGNTDSLGQAAGYRTFYEPENQIGRSAHTSLDAEFTSSPYGWRIAQCTRGSLAQLGPDAPTRSRH